MGYYMRFIDQGSSPLTLLEIEKAMIKSNANYSLEEGTLRFEGQPYAQISINVPSDGLFDEEIEELLEFLEDMTGEVKTVEDVLRSARSIIAVQFLFGDRDADEVLDLISPIWEYLFANRAGLQQCDNEGYYDKDQNLIASE